MRRQEWRTERTRLTGGTMGTRRFRVRMMRSLGLLLAALLWVWGAAAAEAKMDYKVIPLGFAASSLSLNDVPDVTGRWTINNESHGFVKYWDDFYPVDLGAHIIPVKISDLRVVGGTKETYEGQSFVRSDVFRWNPSGGMSILDNLGGNSHAYGMNEDGAIVGFSFGTDHFSYGCLWEPGQAIAALAKNITPKAINRAKQIVANVDTSNRVALLEVPNYTYVPLLPGGIANSGQAINESGQIVGSCLDGSSSLNYGFIWDKVAGLRPLDPEASHPNIPYGINNKGQVVGTVTASGFQWGFFWSKETGMVDLNDCINHDIYPGCHLFQAYGINDNGWIVCAGLYQGQYDVPLLLKPTSPQGAAMAAITTLLLFGVPPIF
jgi:probable HAF family extracellular repeat protein